MIQLIISLFLFIILGVIVVMNMYKLKNMKEEFDKKDTSNVEMFKSISKDIENIKYYLNNTRAVSNTKDKTLEKAISENKKEIAKLKD